MNLFYIRIALHIKKENLTHVQSLWVHMYSQVVVPYLNSGDLQHADIILIYKWVCIPFLFLILHLIVLQFEFYGI